MTLQLNKTYSYKYRYSVNAQMKSCIVVFTVTKVRKEYFIVETNRGTKHKVYPTFPMCEKAKLVSQIKSNDPDSQAKEICVRYHQKFSRHFDLWEKSKGKLKTFQKLLELRLFSAK